MSTRTESGDYRASDERQFLASIVRRLHFTNGIAVTILTLVTTLIVGIFLVILGYLLVQGFPYITNPAFYGTSAEYGVGRQIFNTVYILVLSEIILIPISLAAAIYTVEYARQGPLITIIRFAAETLSGIPSIVLGLFGYLVFSTALGWSYSRLAGAMTLLCLNLPLALRLFEDALTSVPREMREGSLALGATKWRTIRTVVLPSAIPGIVTAIVLSMGKVIAESAVLVFTMGLTSPRNPFKLNWLIPSDTLTVHLYYIQTSGSNTVDPPIVNAISAGSAGLLIVILLLINIVARLIGRAVQRRLTAA